LFGFGENNTTINLIDMDGLTLHLLKVIDSKLTTVDAQFKSGLPILKSELSNASYESLEKQLDNLRIMTKSLQHD
jgi:hypothetical protein